MHVLSIIISVGLQGQCNVLILQIDLLHCAKTVYFLHCADSKSRLFLNVMVFSDEDKAVIKNDYLEKKWSAYRICKEHPAKKWNKVSVQRLLNKFKQYGSMERRPGSGRPRSTTNKENEQIVEELICSQEENPGTHLLPREIEKNTDISRSSVRRMVKRNGLKQFKRLKTPRMNDTTEIHKK